jgi:hypothetical protein
MTLPRRWHAVARWRTPVKRYLFPLATFALIGAFAMLALGQRGDTAEAAGETRLISAFGEIPGLDLVVHVTVAVRPGESDEAAAHAALAAQGARPFAPAEFNLSGLTWDQFFDANGGNDFVEQNYNPANAAAGVDLTFLTNTHATWNGVATSTFAFSYGGLTNNCPSLVRECPGSQVFDGNNDVGWVALKGGGTLAVAWYGTSTDEVDIAMNTKFTWSSADGTSPPVYDAETVMLHENGHGAGIQHSDTLQSIMYPSYQHLQRSLYQDDVDAITAKYPAAESPVTTVAIDTPADGATYAPGEAIAFSGTATSVDESDISAIIAWALDVQSDTGASGSFTAPAVDGPYDLTATVDDPATGGTVEVASVTINVVTPVPGTTSIDIDTPSDGATYAPGETINFSGSATSADGGNISSSIDWALDGQTAMGVSSGSFTAPAVDDAYTLTATVDDPAVGGTVEVASITINVVTPPPPPASLSASIVIGPDPGGDDSYQKNQTVTIDVIVVDELGNPVQGVSVHVEVSTPKNRTLTGNATTDADGVADFTYKVNTGRDGKGTFLVDATATLGALSDGVSTTFEVQ